MLRDVRQLRCELNSSETLEQPTNPHYFTDTTGVLRCFHYEIMVHLCRRNDFVGTNNGGHLVGNADFLVHKNRGETRTVINEGAKGGTQPGCQAHLRSTTNLHETPIWQLTREPLAVQWGSHVVTPRCVAPLPSGADKRDRAMFFCFLFVHVRWMHEQSHYRFQVGKNIYH